MLPTLPAIRRMLSPLRSRGASHVAVLAAVATAMAVVARLESRASTADAAHAMAPGDTTVLWGPGTFVGDNITYWERFSVALFPQKQYIMHVTNGGADGCGAAIDGSVVIDGKIALAPGLINGTVCGSGDWSFVSGSGVHCPDLNPEE